MLPGQLDLFDNTVTAPSTAAVTGIRLRLPSPCHCGSGTVIIGSSAGPHSASIRCAGCDRHRGWLSRAEVERISAIVGESGRPTEPIDIGGAR
jgi:hypothetical protein